MATKWLHSGDVALMAAVARWHHDALEELYRRYAGSVFGLSFRLLGDRARAEEVTQEVFLAMWNEPERFDPERGTIRSFLLTRAHGRSVDVMRSDTSRRRRESVQIQATEDRVDDLEREVVDLAIAEEIRDALAGLPENEREVLELTYFQGRSYREAARYLQQPEGTVKSRIRSGLKRLRGSLPADLERS